jgi:hypothetical protein
MLFMLHPVTSRADDDKPGILFLHLRIEHDGSVRVLDSRAAPGKLKSPQQAHGPLKFELQSKDNNPLWNGAMDDPRVRHFEIENPLGSGKLERRSHFVREMEFMVRVPIHSAAAKLVVFEEEAPKAPGMGRTGRKVLLAHPLPPVAQIP